MPKNPRVEFVQSRLAALADAQKSREMAAYMKTNMLFYGVQKPARELIFRDLKRQFPITTRSEYTDTIEALWSLPHREEKYLALAVAAGHAQFITPACLPLYRRLIIEGAWWDFVDDISTRLVGRLTLEHKGKIGPKMDRWIDDPTMWIRRSALISHINHGEQTDQRQLFDHCLRRAHEKEFFIRKAIGWALRQYARTAPAQVSRFLRRHSQTLSPLSVREAAKHLALE